MNFDMRTFYKWGCILMTISVFGSIWNSFMIWDNLTIGGKISNIAGSILFNMLLAYFFYYLWKITPDTSAPAKVIDAPDLDALIKQFQQEDSNPNMQRKRKVPVNLHN